jgi:FkbM family methyltransferase
MESVGVYGGMTLLKPHIDALRNYLLKGEIRKAKESGISLEFSDEFNFLTYALRLCHINHSQIAQDLWVLYELSEAPAGYFVEFGAGDGIILSNTFLLEREYGWRGVLAEPNAEFHEPLRQNRSAHISTKCIVGKSEGEVWFNQTRDPHLSVIDAYSDKDGHAEARRDGTRSKASAQTLIELLREADAPGRIDYLSIDTEGSELDILQGFDFSAFDIKLLSVEHNHTLNEKAIDDLLRAKGFIRRFANLSDFDGWYRNESLPIK